MSIQAMVIGASAGGVTTLHRVLPQFPASIPYFISLVQHNSSEGVRNLCQSLQHVCHLSVVEGEDKMELRNGHLYIAPSNYHLLLESPYRLGLSLDAQEHHCRPAIDPLFTSAAAVLGRRLVGAIFSGMGSDGAWGLHTVRSHGGICMVQSPASTPYPAMPQAALNRVADAHQFTPDTFYQRLTHLLAKRVVTNTEDH